MITDNIKTSATYDTLSDDFKKAFEFLRRDDLHSLPVGSYPISDTVSAKIQEYSTVEAGEILKWETHRNNAAIQCILEGEEIIGYTFIDTLTPTTDYNAEYDIQFYSGEGSMVKLCRDDFMIVFPQDGHVSKIAPDGKIGKVRKCNIKIKI